MKKLLLIAVLFISVASYSQNELSGMAQAVKVSQPDFYEALKTRAINEWKDDHSMIVYEINKQVKSFIEITELVKGNPNTKGIFNKALREWSEGDVSSIEKATSNPTVDWSMVKYEMEKQIKARNSY